MKNNITIIGINFYPEDTAIGLYSTQMAEYLSHNGYAVNVVTGFPYYPQWKIWDAYRKKSKRAVEAHHDVTIYRYKQYVPAHPTFKSRIVHLLDFTFGSIPNLFKIKHCDLVICVVPFTTSILLGFMLARLRGAKVWVHIQDFEFDAAVESGLAGEKKRVKSKVFDFLFWIEKKLLNKANIVSTISYGMMEKLATKTATQTHFFPNWVDGDFIHPARAKVHCYLSSSKFKILYSGNIGAKQDWDFFLRVVEYFKDHQGIEFIIVGAGAKKEWLIESTRKYHYVIHYDPIPFEELPDLLCSADLHLLFQKNDVIDTVMPSKLLGMMASAKPSLVTGNIHSEVAKVFSTSYGGYFFDSDAFSEVIEAIGSLIDDKIGSQKMGLDARNYIIEHFSYYEVLKNVSRRIKKLLAD